MDRTCHLINRINFDCAKVLDLKKTQRQSQEIEERKSLQRHPCDTHENSIFFMKLGFCFSYSRSTFCLNLLFIFYVCLSDISLILRIVTILISVYE